MHYGIAQRTFVSIVVRHVAACAGIAFCAVSAISQDSYPANGRSSDTLAVMQSGIITVRDLRERLELMPWPGKEKASQADSIKQKALSALIAEKILAAAFDRSDLEESASITRLRRGLENVLLRDMLYKDVVRDVRPPDAESVRIGRARHREEREVMVYQVRSDFDGIVLAGRLAQFLGQDSVLRSYQDDLIIQSSPAVVRYGTMEQAIEEHAYEITPEQVSGPIRSSGDGWLVLVLLERRMNPDAEQQTPDEQIRFVQRVIRARNQAVRAQTFYFDLLRNERAEADSAQFELLAHALESRWKEGEEVYKQDGAFVFSSGLVDILLEDMTDHLDKPFIRTGSGEIPLGEILELLRYEEFKVSSLDPMSVRIGLNEHVKAMVANTVLASEARQRGFHRTESFMRDMRTWDDYWKSRRLYDHILDTVSVTKEELVSYLMKDRTAFDERFEVQVREILTATRDDMNAVLEQLAEGAVFEDIAGNLTIRNAWKPAGGVSDFFPIGEYPEIGYRALLSDIGSLSEVLTLEEGFSIFMTLNKRSRDGRTVDGSGLRSNLERRVLEEKRSRVVSGYVQARARDEGVRIDQDALSAMTMTSVNMFTRRYIGFGGIMTAVPMLSSQWDWLIRIAEDIQTLP